MKFRIKSRTIIFLHDLAMVPVAWLGAYWLRFNLSHIPQLEMNAALTTLPLVMLIQGAVFHYFGLYRGVWHFSSVPDLVRISKSILAGVLLITAALFLYCRLEGVPRSTIPLYVCLLLLALCVPRFLYRFWKDRILKVRRGKRTLIVGAGAAGEMLVRDLLRDTDSTYLPIAFLDDDQNKKDREIQGVRVMASVRKMPALIEKLDIEAVLIAVPSATDAQMRRIVEICEQCCVPFQTLPSVTELLSYQVNRSVLRDVSIEDILGREPVNLDWPLIEASLKTKRILVTGGGGSIGTELCRQLAGINPRSLIIFDQSEFNLYNVDSMLKREHPELSHAVVLGDVTNRKSVRETIRFYEPDVIFHTAAYKHVPMLEGQAREAVSNNLLGTKTVAEEAAASGVERFVLISTDKAVNPTNVMGATKRAAEILCQNMDKAGGTRFITVRFGNVLDSTGSVVPLFREQIKAGGPLTVTHPEVKRYFMTLSEACQLIMQAEAAGGGGEIFVLDMGKSIKISYLAEQMILLSGKQPGKDIEIEYIGLRPGEKLFEELFHEQEALKPTAHEKLLLADARRYDENETQWLHHIRLLVQACENNGDEILPLLKKLVPEYCVYPEHAGAVESESRKNLPGFTAGDGRISRIAAE